MEAIYESTRSVDCLKRDVRVASATLAQSEEPLKEARTAIERVRVVAVGASIVVSVNSLVSRAVLYLIVWRAIKCSRIARTPFSISHKGKYSGEPHFNGKVELESFS